jgi:hypothetical protein
MQIANIMVAVGGDAGTTVPKYEMTVSEIAVLQRLHGNDAVFDIDPCGEIERRDREEIARLGLIYRSPDGGPHAVVKELFPGAAARAFHNLDELTTAEGNPLPEQMFKAASRVKAPAAKKGKKTPAPEPQEEQPEDGKLFE